MHTSQAPWDYLGIVDQSSRPTNAPDIGTPERLAAANATADLLEGLSNTCENVFFTSVTISGSSSNIINSARLHELSNELDKWALKYDALTRSTEDGPSNCIK